MPRQVLLAYTVEAALLFLTLVFLVQPRWIVPFRSISVRGILRSSGWMLLCITFCWSVVLGIILGLNQMTFSI